MVIKPFTQVRRNSCSHVLPVVLLVLLAMLLTACKADPRLEFIQGGWYYKDAHLANIPGESAQVTTVEFDNGYVSMDSCCFTEVYFSGNYSVAEKEENSLTLDLFNLKGHTGGFNLTRNDAMVMMIKIDPETDTIKINGSGPFERVSR